MADQDQQTVTTPSVSEESGYESAETHLGKVNRITYQQLDMPGLETKREFPHQGPGQSTRGPVTATAVKKEVKCQDETPYTKYMQLKGKDIVAETLVEELPLQDDVIFIKEEVAVEQSNGVIKDNPPQDGKKNTFLSNTAQLQSSDKPFVFKKEKDEDAEPSQCDRSYFNQSFPKAKRKSEKGMMQGALPDCLKEGPGQSTRGTVIAIAVKKEVKCEDGTPYTKYMQLKGKDILAEPLVKELPLQDDVIFIKEVPVEQSNGTIKDNPPQDGEKNTFLSHTARLQSSKRMLPGALPDPRFEQYGTFLPPPPTTNSLTLNPQKEIDLWNTHQKRKAKCMSDLGYNTVPQLSPMPPPELEPVRNAYPLPAQLTMTDQTGEGFTGLSPRGTGFTGRLPVTIAPHIKQRPFSTNPAPRRKYPESKPLKRKIVEQITWEHFPLSSNPHPLNTNKTVNNLGVIFKHASHHQGPPATIREIFCAAEPDKKRYSKYVIVKPVVRHTIA